jgi:1-acyl-sn-glycerol-3-phosphate acyltransferase
MADMEVGKLYPVAKAILTPLFAAAWKLDIRGLEHIPDSGGAILCPNHTSVLDSFFVPAVLPRRITYVGKAEYMDDWKTRTLFPAMGMIPIDREGGDAGERALATAQRILESGQLFGIYPEGTRSRDGRLYRGHTGPARLALRTGAPIVPIGIVGTREVMPPDAKVPRLRQPVKITFGRPIDPGRYDANAERLALRQMIDEVMYEIRELSGQDYVDEYANKKRRPTDDPAAGGGERVAEPGRRPTADGTRSPRTEVVVDVPGSANGTVDVGPGSDAGEPTTGPFPLENSEFVAATQPKSSAEMLQRRPKRNSG